MLTFELLVGPRGCDLSIIIFSFLLAHASHIPAGEASDWAMSAAMAELGFNLLPNMWEGAMLKTDPGKPLT